MKHIGLVLEGGGMRGIYTAGILDAFIDMGLEFPYVIGVSSGATIGSSYITKQKGRSKRIFLDWSQDKRFVGLSNFIKEGSYFGMNFLFEVLPNELEKFDYDKFRDSDAVLVSCLTNCDTGETVYINHKTHSPKRYMSKVIRACNSLPIISPHVEIDNHRYLDGFLTDPLPLNKSIQDGNTYNIVILTKKAGIEQKASWSDRLFKNMTRAKYPKIGKRIEETVDNYYSCLNSLEELQKQNKVFVFRPKENRLESRYSTNREALLSLYEDGYNNAMDQMDELKAWIVITNDLVYN